MYETSLMLLTFGEIVIGSRLGLGGCPDSGNEV